MLDPAHQVDWEQKGKKKHFPASLPRTATKRSRRFVHLDIIKLNTQTHRRADGGWESLRNLRMIANHSCTHLHSQQRPNADNCTSNIILALARMLTHTYTWPQKVRDGLYEFCRVEEYKPKKYIHMPDVCSNFKPPHVCLEVLHLPECRKGLAAKDGMRRAQKHKRAGFPSSLDTHLLIYGFTHTHVHTGSERAGCD